MGWISSVVFNMCHIPAYLRAYFILCLIHDRASTYFKSSAVLLSLAFLHLSENYNFYRQSQLRFFEFSMTAAGIWNQDIAKTSKNLIFIIYTSSLYKIQKNANSRKNKRVDGPQSMIFLKSAFQFATFFLKFCTFVKRGKQPCFKV